MSGARTPRKAAALVAGIAFASIAAVPVAAVAAPATHQGAQFPINDVEADTNPCTGMAGTLATTGHGSMHQTVTADGSEHDSIALEGDATFTPDDPSALTYAGHFTLTYTEQDNRSNGAITTAITIVTKAADGSKMTYTELGHTSSSASGWTFEVDRSSLRCS